MLSRFRLARTPRPLPRRQRPRGPSRGIVSGTTNGIAWANSSTSSVFWSEPHSHDWSFTALGTVSASATPFRGASCGVLRTPAAAYLFDCGEGALGRLRDSYLTSTSALQRVFLTHLHADHVLGLPAILLQWLSFRYTGDGGAPDVSGALREEADGPSPLPSGAGGARRLEIFGPPGVLELVRASFPTLSARARAELPLDIVELVPAAGARCASAGASAARPTPAQERLAAHAAAPIGRFRLLHPGADGALRLVDDREHRVLAAPVTHSTACYGYVVEGKQRRHLLPERVRARGIPAGEAYRRLVETGAALAPDGSTVRLDDVSYLGPRPNKFALLGDNCAAPPLIKDLAQGADLLVHEATIVNGSRSEALAKAHSTPEMAGETARDCGARRLLLTHFSPTFALRDAYSSVHMLGEDAVGRLLRSGAAGGGGGARREAAGWLQEQAAAMLDEAAGGAVAAASAPAAAGARLPPAPPPMLGARDWLERSSGYSPQPRLLAAGLLETRRHAAEAGSGSARASAAAPITTTVDANLRELLRWRGAQGPLAVRRLWAFSHPEVRDHATAAAVAAAAQRSMGSEHVLCARDFMTVIVPSLGRDAASPLADAVAAGGGGGSSSSGGSGGAATARGTDAVPASASPAGLALPALRRVSRRSSASR